MSWSQGYVTEVDYTFGYYPETDPRRAAFALAAAGYAPPPMKEACELGFGQGLSIGLHGAAQPGTQFWGTDFNPNHAAFAKSLAAPCGGDVRLYDQAFEDFCHRTDLPDFDFIALHGIWSWVSDANKNHIVEFARRRLKVGGVLYISYNTLPGWSAMATIRHLMMRHSARASAPGAPISQRGPAAVDFAAQILATNTRYQQANPGVAERVARMKGHAPSYLAHEYLNQDWTPMYFADVEDALAPAKLKFGISAALIDHFEELNLTPDQRAIARSFDDPSFRETLRDVVTNQQFRRDYWIRGGRVLTATERMDAMRAQRFALCRPAADVERKLKGLVGEAEILAETFDPLLELMADHKPRTLHDIERALAPKGRTFRQAATAVHMLMAQGALGPANDDRTIGEARKRAAAFNAIVLNRARSSGGELQHLASPVLGAGVQVGHIDQLALRGVIDGRSTPTELAQHIWAAFAAENRKIVKDGETLETAEANLSELEKMMPPFLERRLPMLRALGIIEGPARVR